MFHTRLGAGETLDGTVARSGASGLSLTIFALMFFPNTFRFNNSDDIPNSWQRKTFDTQYFLAGWCPKALYFVSVCLETKGVEAPRLCNSCTRGRFAVAGTSVLWEKPPHLTKNTHTQLNLQRLERVSACSYHCDTCACLPSQSSPRCCNPFFAGSAKYCNKRQSLLLDLISKHSRGHFHQLLSCQRAHADT